MELPEIEALMVIIAGLVLLSLEDIQHKKISLGIIIAMGLLLTGISVWEKNSALFIITGLLPGLAATVFSLLSKGGLGLGDAFLMLALGVYLGAWNGLAVLMMGLLLSSAVGIILIILKKAHMKTELPFVPFYLAGFLLWEVTQWLF